jgi:hypothetical protein
VQVTRDHVKVPTVLEADLRELGAAHGRCINAITFATVPPSEDEDQPKNTEVVGTEAAMAVVVSAIADVRLFPALVSVNFWHVIIKTSEPVATPMTGRPRLESTTFVGCVFDVKAENVTTISPSTEEFAWLMHAKQLTFYGTVAITGGWLAGAMHASIRGRPPPDVPTAIEIRSMFTTEGYVDLIRATSMYAGHFRLDTLDVFAMMGYAATSMFPAMSENELRTRVKVKALLLKSPPPSFGALMEYVLPRSLELTADVLQPGRVDALAPEQSRYELTAEDLFRHVPDGVKKMRLSLLTDFSVDLFTEYVARLGGRQQKLEELDIEVSSTCMLTAEHLRLICKAWPGLKNLAIVASPESIGSKYELVPPPDVPRGGDVAMIDALTPGTLDLTGCGDYRKVIGMFDLTKVRTLNLFADCRGDKTVERLTPGMENLSSIHITRLGPNRPKNEWIESAIDEGSFVFYTKLAIR